jgi:hypothetical protein
MDDRILNKIKKCLALSTSSEPAEAAAAMRQAQKLMEMHGISTSDLRQFDVGSASIKSCASVSKIKDWELRLVNLVAKAFGCRVLWSSSSSYSQDVYGSFVLIGIKGQIELAEYTCEVMQRKLMKGRNKFVNSLPSYLSRSAKIKEADGFCHGWVSAVAKTVFEFAMGEEHKKAVDEYVTKMASGKEASLQKRKAGVLGLMAGTEAGTGESIHRPVNEKKQTYIGG